MATTHDAMSMNAINGRTDQGEIFSNFHRVMGLTSSYKWNHSE
jgi:hypothetical protein